MMHNIVATAAVMLLTLIKAVEIPDDPLLWAVLGAIAIAAIWFETYFFNKATQHVVLTMVVGIQALVYFEHFGPILVVPVSAGALFVVWSDEIKPWWKKHGRHRAAVPEPLEDGTRKAIRAVAANVHGKRR